MKTALKTLILALTVLFASMHSVSAARLYMSSPPATVCTGGTFTLQLLLDTEGQAINAGQVDLALNPAIGQINSINTSGSIFKFFAEGPSFDNGAGTIHMIGGLPTPGYQGGNGVVAELSLVANGTGDPNLRYSGSSDILLDDGLGTSAALSLENQNFSVLPGTDPSCTAPVTCSNRTIQEGQTANLAASGGDGAYSWTTTGGIPASGTGSSLGVTYATAGSYAVSVIDGSGKTGNCAVTVNIPPPPAFGCSPSVRNISPGGTAVFSAVGGTGPYNWSSTGGIPASGTGNSFSGTYDTLGSYTVTMTDALGASDSCTVNVNPPATPGPTPTPCPTCQLYSDDGEVLDLRLCEVQVECANAEPRFFDVFLGADDPTQCPIYSRCEEDLELIGKESPLKTITKNIFRAPLGTFVTVTQGIYIAPFIFGVGLGTLLLLAAYMLTRVIRRWYVRFFGKKEHPPRYPDIPHNT